jgi:hypothetical protein
MANKIDVKPFQEGLEELLDTDKKEPTVDSEAAGIRAEAEGLLPTLFGLTLEQVSEAARVSL